MQAKLQRGPFGEGVWHPSLEDALRAYLTFSTEERALCSLQTVDPVTFNDDLPPRRMLNASMIEMLAEKLARERP